LSALDEGDPELLALADATDRVADALTDPAMAVRLRAIADEIRAMGLRGTGVPGVNCQLV
jgi:hypothetical protein